MSKEEKFKKTLHHLLDEQHFNFEESDWEAAKKVIDENRRKRRLRPLWFVFTGLVILSGFLMLWPEGKPSRLRSDKPVRDTKPTLAQNTTKIIQEENMFVAKPLEQKAAKQSAGSVSGNQSKVSNSQTTLPDAKSGSFEVSQTRGAAAVSEQHTNPLSGSAQASNDVPTPPLPALPVAPVNEPLYQEKNSSVLAEEKSGILLATTVPVSALASESPLPVSEEKIIVQEAVVSESPLQKDSSELNPGAITEIGVPEVKKKMLWSVEAGFNVLYGWNSPAGNEGRGFNPVLGINFHNAITDRFDYSLGLHVTSIAHLGAYSDTSKITKYNFGEESQVTVISPQTFYYLNVPLRFSWNFGNKQSVGTALEFGYLLNVKSTVETYEESFSTGEKQKTKELGYTEGVAPFNFQMGFFYRRELFKNLYIQPELFFGFVDLKDDVFFKYSGKERSSGLKLTLLYSIKNR